MSNSVSPVEGPIIQKKLNDPPEEEQKSVVASTTTLPSTTTVPSTTTDPSTTNVTSNTVSPTTTVPPTTNVTSNTVSPITTVPSTNTKKLNAKKNNNASSTTVEINDDELDKQLKELELQDNNTEENENENENINMNINMNTENEDKKENEDEDEDEDDDEDKSPLKSMYNQNLVNVLGERVSLVGVDGLTESFKVVDFDKYYLPEQLDAKQKELAKDTFRALFGQIFHKVKPMAGKKNFTYSLDVFPPCDEELKNIVLLCLLKRKELLRIELVRKGIKTPSQLKQNMSSVLESDVEKTLGTKAEIYHYAKLLRFIDAYAQTKCVDLSADALKYPQMNLTDKQIEELLKQLVFFILQNKNPLPDYAKVPPGGIKVFKTLQQGLLGDKFQNFYKSYSKKYTVSNKMQSIIGAIERGDPRYGDLKQQLIQQIQTIFSDVENPFPNIDFESKGFDDIFIEILQKIKGHNDEVEKIENQRKALDKEIQNLKGEKASLEDYKKIVDAQFASAKERIQELEQSDEEKELEKLQLETDFAEIKNKYEYLTADINHIIEDKNQTIRELEEEEEDNKRMLDSLQDTVISLEQDLVQKDLDYAEKEKNYEAFLDEKELDIAKLEDQLNTLEEEKTTATSTVQTLQGNVESLRNQLQEATAARDTLSKEKETLQQQLNTVSANKQSLEQEYGAIFAEIDELEKQIKEMEEAEKPPTQQGGGDDEEEDPQIVLMQEDIAQKNDKLKFLDEQKKANSIEMGDLQKAIDEKVAAENEQHALVSDLQTQLETQKAELQRLQGIVDQGNSHLPEATENYKQQIQEKKDSIEALQEKLDLSKEKQVPDLTNEQLLEAIQTVSSWLKQGKVEDAEEEIKDALDDMASLFKGKQTGQETLDRKLYSCAFVYLFSLLWETHFVEQPNESLYTLLTMVINSVSKNSINSLLSLLQKLVALQDQTLSDEEINLLETLYDTLTNNLEDFGFKDESAFMQTIQEHFLSVSPSVKPKSNVVIDLQSGKVSSNSNAKSQNNKIAMSFFEVFYFYMFAIRYFLNITEQETECPLPPLLKHR